MGGCVVSKTQYAFSVERISLLDHLMTRCLGVRSRRGGRGKLCTFNFCLVDILIIDFGFWALGEVGMKFREVVIFDKILGMKHTDFMQEQHSVA